MNQIFIGYVQSIKRGEDGVGDLLAKGSKLVFESPPAAVGLLPSMSKASSMLLTAAVGCCSVGGAESCGVEAGCGSGGLGDGGRAPGGAVAGGDCVGGCGVGGRAPRRLAARRAHFLPLLLLCPRGLMIELKCTAKYSMIILIYRIAHYYMFSSRP